VRDQLEKEIACLMSFRIKESSMKKTVIAAAIGIMALSGCASVTDYNLYAQTQQLIATKQAEADIARANALKDIAASGDSSAKVAAVMSLQFAAQSQPRDAGQIAPPTSFSDTLLKWASVLVPSFTQVYAIGKSTDVAITHSNNSVKAQQSNNNMVVDLVKGRNEIIVGQEGDVLLYPVAP
jgi:hypothetical protein